MLGKKVEEIWISYAETLSYNQDPKDLVGRGHYRKFPICRFFAAVVSFAFSLGSPAMITMPFGPCSSNTLLNQNLDTLHRDMNLQNSVTFQPLPIETCAKEALKNKRVEIKTGPHIQIRLLFTYLYIR